MTASLRRLQVVPETTDTAAPLYPERVAALTRRAAAGGAPTVETHAPATGALIGELPQSSAADNGGDLVDRLPH